MFPQNTLEICCFVREFICKLNSSTSLILSLANETEERKIEINDIKPLELEHC